MGGRLCICRELAWALEPKSRSHHLWIWGSLSLQFGVHTSLVHAAK